MPVQSTAGIYYAFVAVVFLVYWTAAEWRLARLAALLAANLLFCAHYSLIYVVLLPACGTVDYLIGLGLTRLDAPAWRRALVSLSVAMNLALLVGSRHAGWVVGLGLSFYTFQALTYTIDLYRRDGIATPSLLAYLVSASFFASLQAGPISRLTELTKQVAAKPALNRIEGGRAFFLIGLGLLKKTLIADYLGRNLVNRVFDTPTLYSGAETLIAVYAYSLELYFDFSGYTDIARGVAMLLGIRLPINFDRPYLAANLTDFWRRWHISFSNWLRDYLFFSLPGKRSKIMPYVNLVITMALGGLWHGFGWTFLTWGLLHGVGLAATRGWWAWRGRRQAGAGAIFATYQYVCLTWVFFRAGSMENAWAVLGRIASLTAGFENIAPLLWLVLLLAAAAMLVKKQWYAWTMERFAASPFFVHAAALAVVAVAVQLAGGRGAAPFVYSKF